VASTKAFTTQLTALAMLMVALAKNGPAAEQETELVRELLQLPGLLEKTLVLDAEIQALSESFADKRHALFLGRGPLQAIALEGALKLKEISYIHAEGYAAAELKHGPLALVDENMPVVAVAPNNELLEKLKSNLHEVRARGGKLIVFADPETRMRSEEGITVIQMPAHATALQSPIVFAIPMQLLAYHVAVLKGTDVDQPRNLAKSLTVE
jgi:glutamine---fructose-6-phosphate transaminase (isomerizing)